LPLLLVIACCSESGEIIKGERNSMYIKFKVQSVIISALIVGKIQYGDKDKYLLSPINFTDEDDGSELIAKSVEITYGSESDEALLNYEAAHINYKAQYHLASYTIESSP
jgi:hypothetical protein